MDVIRMDDSDTTASRLTKEGIFEKVMWGQHLTSAEKAFVLNGYRPLPARSVDVVHLDGAGQGSPGTAPARAERDGTCKHPFSPGREAPGEDPRGPAAAT